MKKKRNELFEEAMDQFNKLARLSLEALEPYGLHSRGKLNCALTCPDCRLEAYYKKITGLVTVIR